MTKGRNEQRTLKGGQTLYLVRPPGEKWRITQIDYPSIYRPMEGGPRVEEGNFLLVGILETQRGLPDSWRELRFDSEDEAVAFAESELATLE